jgi:hypothetical protein
MTLPLVPTDLAGLNRAAVRAAYLKLANRDLLRLENDILLARLLEDAAGQPSPVDTNVARALLSNTKDLWRDLEHDSPAFAGKLTQAVTALNAANAFWTGNVPAAQETSPTPMAKHHLDTLTHAVYQVEHLAQTVGAGQCDWMLEDLFFTPTAAAEAKIRFKAIPGALRRILGETKVATVGTTDADSPRRGFVLNPNLPASMAALAHGDGPSAYISILPSALTGPSWKFVSALVHEGSHTLDTPPGATIDFAYIERKAHYRLSPECAVRNAANYQQIAINLLAHEVEAAPKGDLDAAGLALVMLDVKATRAWVRAYHLKPLSCDDPTSLDFQLLLDAFGGSLPGNVGRLRWNVARRRTVAKMLGALRADVGVGLADAIFADLDSGTTSLLNTLKRAVTLSESDGFQVRVDGRPFGMRIVGPKDARIDWRPKTLAELAQHVIRALAKIPAAAAKVSDDESLAEFVGGIAEFESEEFQPFLQAFFVTLEKQYSALPKPPASGT